MKGDGVNSPAGAYSRPHPSVQPDAIRMVEDFIREWSGHYNCRALWEHLPNQMMYQTYKEIIEYLLSSNRIVIDSEGYVGWIFDYNLYKRYAQRPELRVR